MEEIKSTGIKGREVFNGLVAEYSRCGWNRDKVATRRDLHIFASRRLAANDDVVGRSQDEEDDWQQTMTLWEGARTRKTTGSKR